MLGHASVAATAGVAGIAVPLTTATTTLAQAEEALSTDTTDAVGGGRRPRRGRGRETDDTRPDHDDPSHPAASGIDRYCSGSCSTGSRATPGMVTRQPLRLSLHAGCRLPGSDPYNHWLMPG